MVSTIEIQTVPAATQLALLRQYGPVWRIVRTDNLEVWVVRALSAIDAVKRTELNLAEVLVVEGGYTGFVDDVPIRIDAPLMQQVPWPAVREIRD